MTFHDHFSRDSQAYAKYRPRYPAPLFEWLAATGESRELAWDCATGNGQAAVGLASWFTRVVASDASLDQLRHATPLPNIEYRHTDAYASGLETHSVDLVTCAQAVHWLQRERFFAEARRVLRARSVIAVWGYHIPKVLDSTIDAAIHHFHDEVVGPYWPPERRLVLDRFTTIDFPFEPLDAPEFDMRCAWTLDDFAAYLGTQSATDRYRRDHGGDDPVPGFVREVQESWGGRQRVREVVFPIFIRAGRS